MFNIPYAKCFCQTLVPLFTATSFITHLFPVSSLIFSFPHLSSYHHLFLHSFLISLFSFPITLTILFLRFLTKREQQLMQRRHHAEELLQWKQRLDQEEAEVRRMEKEALAVWDRQTPRDRAESQEKEISDISPSPSHHRSSEPRTDSEKGEATGSSLFFERIKGKIRSKLIWTNNNDFMFCLFSEYVSEGDCSSVTPESSIHTEGLGSQLPGSPSPVQPASIPETPLASIQSSPANYTQDFTSASQSPGRQVCMNGFFLFQYLVSSLQQGVCRSLKCVKFIL